MSSSEPAPRVDTRFSDPESRATAWTDATKVLEEAELYWLSTVRGDGRPHVTPLIGVWADGLEVVVEGRAVRVADQGTLQRLADAYEAKYGSAWHFDVGEGRLETGGNVAAVFRVEMDKVLAFAKDPHAQTTYVLSQAP